MFPILFDFGVLKIYSYGLCIAIGAFLAVLYFQNKALKYGLDKRFVENYPFFLLACGLSGARILYVLTEWKSYIGSPLSVFRVTDGGFVFHGGLILGLVFSYFYLRQKKTGILPLGDIAVPALAIAHTFGRIGCFFAGCCHGRGTDTCLGVVFRNPDSMANLYMRMTNFSPVHPAQLYEAAGNLGIFLILNHKLKNKKFDGDVFLLYFVLYGVLRMVTEYFRADDRGYLIAGYAVMTWLFFLTGIAAFFYRRKLAIGNQKNIFGRK